MVWGIGNWELATAMGNCQHLRGPDAELRAPLRLHAVADGGNDVEVVVFDLVGLTVSSSMCKICTYLIFEQFAFFKNIANMFGDDTSFSFE